MKIRNPFLREAWEKEFDIQYPPIEDGAWALYGEMRKREKGRPFKCITADRQALAERCSLPHHTGGHMTGAEKASGLTNNMGCITQEQCEAFAHKVLDAEFPTNVFAWTDAGSILIGQTVYLDRRWIGKYPWEAKERILHEIAHIRTWPEDDTHGELFHREYARLVLCYLGQEEGQ